MRKREEDKEEGIETNGRERERERAEGGREERG